MTIVDAALRLRTDLRAARLDVPFVYDPLTYAWAPHAAYLERYGEGPAGRVLLVGMNPGPRGMGQTGVPFGDVGFVRDWMRISGRVEQPERPHPKRKVDGFACQRREPSGSRLYGWAQQRYGEAARFFGEFAIANYCPLLFFDEEGKNLTPPQLSAAARRAVETACDDHLERVISSLRPRLVVGIGGFAAERARLVVDDRKLGVPVGTILHPSPASPLANRGWAEQAEKQLAAMGVRVPQ